MSKKSKLNESNSQQNLSEEAILEEIQVDNESVTDESSLEGELLDEEYDDTVEMSPRDIDIDSLQEQLEEALQKANDNREIALRAQAETENVRKRAVKDVQNAHKYSLEKLVNEFLPVKDSLELGLNASDQADVSSLTEGMELTLKMFTGALEKCGVTMVDPTGEKFDPERHQAMTMIDSADVESGIVIDVMQKGYLLNERLIRPAMVVVAK